VRAMALHTREEFEQSERDVLMDKLRRGELAPGEAEVEATRLGIGPLARTPDPNADPRNETFWGLAMVLAWITTRELSAVCWTWPDWREDKEWWRLLRRHAGHDTKGYVLDKLGPVALIDFHMLAASWQSEGKCLVGIKDGIKELLSKLRAGSDIEATGIPSTGGKRQVIPSHEWRDLDVHEERKQIVVRTDHGSGPGYDDVALAHVAVLKLWPEKGSSVLRRTAKSRAVSECTKWLEQCRRAGPPEKTKAEYKKQACARFDIGPDQFKTAWRTAATNVPNDRWGSPGRPSKGASKSDGN
jgi:hypothetical protein